MISYLLLFYALKEEKIFSKLYLLWITLLYFSGLSLRKASERLSQLFKRNHVSIWNWIQKYKPKMVCTKIKRILEYIIDETLIKVGLNYVWIWVAIEPENRQILALSTSKERNNAYRRKIHRRPSKESWQSSCINRWWYLVSPSL